MTHADAWSRYWSLTHRGAIDLAATDPVAVALREHWDRQLGWLQGCASIVDVGSGPAILARHLMAAHPDALYGLRWICIDDAQLPTAQELAAGWSVVMRGGEDFASAAPAAEPVDGLVSNFGLEYVDRTAVAAACRRWLKPGGRMCCILHARDSLIDQQADASATDIRIALDEVGLFARAADLVEAIASLPADPAERRRHAPGVRAAYNDAVDHLKRTMESRGARSATWIEMLQGIHALIDLATRGQVDTARAGLRQRQDDYRSELERLALMQCCALNEGAMEALLADLQREALRDVRHDRLTCESGVVGWALTATRG